jgi:DNA-binding NarL/FixJ family response regulator
MNKLIRVFIVEDHAIFREGLKKILSAMPGIRIVGESENGAAFLKQLPKTDPDVVLLDIRMPVMDGIEAAEKALKLKPGLKIIVLSMYGEEDYLYSMILLGISGFLLKTTSLGNLETAIRTVAEGQQFFSPELNMVLAKKVKQLTSNELPVLTKKESEVLRLLCMGFTTHQIATQMCISKRTVEGYRSKLIEKTGVANTINLVIFAIRNRLVSLDELHSL